MSYVCGVNIFFYYYSPQQMFLNKNNNKTGCLNKENPHWLYLIHIGMTLAWEVAL